MPDLDKQYDSYESDAPERLEPGDPGSTSEGVETTPRGNQPADEEDVQKGVDKLKRIVNW